MPSCKPATLRIVFWLALLLLLVAVSGISAVGQQLIGSVTAPTDDPAMGVNSITKKIYVPDEEAGIVTVIDEESWRTVTIPAAGANYIAVDELRNKIYVTGYSGLIIIDGATNTATPLDLPISAGQVAVNTVTNKIYILGGDKVAEVDGTTLNVTLIPAGALLYGLAVNSATNKIYVIDEVYSILIVIDGVSHESTTVHVVSAPLQVLVNSYTNKIYVTSYGTLTIVDGATLGVQNDTLGYQPTMVVLDPLRNKMYTVDPYNGSSLMTIDLATLSVRELPLEPNQLPIAIAIESNTNITYLTYYYESYPQYYYGLLAIHNGSQSLRTVFTADYLSILAVDSATGRVYIADQNRNLIYIVAGPRALRFVPVTPCRVVDTRNPDGDLGGPPIQGGTYRYFPLTAGCHLPSDVPAYSLNVTVVPHGPLGYLTLFPAGQNRPAVSNMNSVDGRTKANAAIVPGGTHSAVDVYASNTTDVVLDVNGYFTTSSASALSFYPLDSCRVVDTRGPNGALGGPYLRGGHERDFPVRASNCAIPSTAQAYSLNITALPRGALGYLTVWPQGQPQPGVSTLNAPTGTATANAALVTAGSGGGVAVFPSNNTDLLIDVNGYFAAPGAGGLSLYTVQPCRVLDTRQHGGAFSGTILVDVIDSGCGLETAEALVLNATVVPNGRLGDLNVWPTTRREPPTSTLDAWDGVITSNMTIVTDIDGWLDAYASDPTQLVLDGFSYFAP